MKTSKKFIIQVNLKNKRDCRGCPCLIYSKESGGSLNECYFGHSDIHYGAVAQVGKIAHGWDRPQSCIYTVETTGTPKRKK